MYLGCPVYGFIYFLHYKYMNSYKYDFILCMNSYIFCSYHVWIHIFLTEAASACRERAARAARAKPELTSCPDQAAPDLCRSVAPDIYNIRVSIIQGLFPEKSDYSLKKSNRPSRFVWFSSDFFVHYRYSDIVENGCNRSDPIHLNSNLDIESDQNIQIRFYMQHRFDFIWLSHHVISNSVFLNGQQIHSERKTKKKWTETKTYLFIGEFRI
jgi:hypothetical protein